MRVVFSAIKVLLAVAVLNGAARVGLVYWNFYQFKDQAQQAALFGSQTPTDVLHNTVIAEAGRLLIPIADDEITVTREGSRTLIQATYVQPVEYFPNRNYPLKLSFSVEGFNVMSTGR